MLSYPLPSDVSVRSQVERRKSRLLARVDRLTRIASEVRAEPHGKELRRGGHGAVPATGTAAKGTTSRSDFEAS